eukprot:TRINITY_DN11559_c0_g1::TRINITY_DN11559_c0_g1_i1::g.21998::m.21998 TRINITY_DN11559_c0_g1::TRINITY_DN11559_c0_g1_i1::g.21998  ORF type:complete len:234 (+),score=74.35,sp/P46209/USF_AQUPY/34.16/2e-29,DLH/PF01738.13/6.7e-48,Abhydrolase_5/PF12695.2/1.2e-09,Abhydrolase_6/PF12697.2/0.00067,Abhydrolase_6/PF12697.2/16,Peptidase_S9/PF00326.16/1.1,Peptidase_S9/PF00326.16/0.0095,BAAT_C/PF08840.6/0.0066,BAAT_C/PF08840.6/6.2,Abhydrolase_3/PF07859.8/1.6,Abhydrolase_3/PF07859.8/0.69,AXE1/PF05448.7/2e+02,AXE1/P
MEHITFKRTDGSDVPGFVAGPAGAPAVIVLQEWWGITEQIKVQALHVSKEGFRVLVPDLYRGKLGVNAEEASHLMGNLDWPMAVDDIRGAVKYLRDTGSKKIGITGFCMGGALSLAAGTLVDGIDAAVPFYGIPSGQLADMSAIKVPVQAHFGNKDAHKGFSDPESADKLEAALKTAGVPYEFYRYEDEGHAFMNDLDEMVQRRKALGFGDKNQEVIDLAWSRVFAFFKKYLA